MSSQKAAGGELTRSVHSPAALIEFLVTTAVYGLAPSSTVASKPAGQWNTFEIEATNTSIKVTLNGQPVTNYTIPATDPRLRVGHIGLQCHTGNVQFQNVQIQTLPRLI
jgi:hypothetical protein